MQTEAGAQPTRPSSSSGWTLWKTRQDPAQDTMQRRGDKYENGQV